MSVIIMASEGLLQCPVCIRTFGNPMSLNIHKSQQHPLLVNRDKDDFFLRAEHGPSDSQSVENSSAKQRPRYDSGRQSTPDKCWNCGFCGRKFMTHTVLAAHLKKRHSSQTIDPEEYSGRKKGVQNKRYSGQRKEHEKYDPSKSRVRSECTDSVQTDKGRSGKSGNGKTNPHPAPTVTNSRIKSSTVRRDLTKDLNLHSSRNTDAMRNSKKRKKRGKEMEQVSTRKQKDKVLFTRATAEECNASETTQSLAGVRIKIESEDEDPINQVQNSSDGQRQPKVNDNVTASSWQGEAISCLRSDFIVPTATAVSDPTPINNNDVNHSLSHCSMAESLHICPEAISDQAVVSSICSTVGSQAMRTNTEASVAQPACSIQYSGSSIYSQAGSSSTNTHGDIHGPTSLHTTMQTLPWTPERMQIYQQIDQQIDGTTWIPLSCSELPSPTPGRFRFVTDWIKMPAAAMRSGTDFNERPAPTDNQHDQCP